MKKNRIIKNCFCGKKFESCPSQNRKYCSTSCRSKYKPRKTNFDLYTIIKCKNCRKEFIDLKCKKRKYCCKKCLGEYLSKNQRGKNNPTYNKDRKKRSFKSRIEWSEWRKIVFERDQYICQYCSKTNCNIEPHHLKPKSTNPNLVYDVNNGITLCKDCHRTLHRLKPSNKYLLVDEFPLAILDEVNK